MAGLIVVVAGRIVGIVGADGSAAALLGVGHIIGGSGTTGVIGVVSVIGGSSTTSVIGGLFGRFLDNPGGGSLGVGSAAVTIGVVGSLLG